MNSIKLKIADIIIQVCSENANVDFVEENGRVYLVKKRDASSKTRKYRRLRGIATVKMTTDEIMALTRGEK